MCASGGIKGHKTNHSLRATAATEMFRCGAPEKLMQERTGHWSVEALQTYQHLEESQHKIVSSLLFTLTDLSTRFFRSNSYLQLHFNSSNSYATDISKISRDANCMPLPPTTQVTNSTEEYIETELDKLFSLVDM